MTTVRPVDRLSAAEAAEVLALASAAEQADGVYPLSEDVVLRVRGGGAPTAHTHFLAYAGEHLAGYAYLERDGSGELFVHPSARRHGHGTGLLTAAGHGPLRFWAHGIAAARRDGRGGWHYGHAPALGRQSPSYLEVVDRLTDRHQIHLL